MGYNNRYHSDKKEQLKPKNISEDRPPQHKRANMDSSQNSRASRNGNSVVDRATAMFPMEAAMSNVETDDGFELVDYNPRHTPPSTSTQSTDTTVPIRGHHNGATDPTGFLYSPALTRDNLQWHERTLEETYAGVEHWVHRGDGSRRRAGGRKSHRKRSHAYSNRNDSRHPSTIFSSSNSGDYMLADEGRATEYVAGTGSMFDDHSINPIVYQSPDLDI